MTARVFRSTDFAAPQISGSSTDLCGILLACLVNGYGNQNVSISRAGSLATVTTPQQHGLVKLAKVRISGANQPEYNGEFTVTVTGANTFTYIVGGNPTSPATGTIIAKLDGAGWSNPYTGGSNDIRVFKQGTPSNGFFLRVDGSGGGGLNSRVIGYESMTGASAGINAFPLESQVAGGLYMQTLSGTAGARPWVVIANERFVFCHVNANNAANSTSGQLFLFGDISSLKPGDQYNTLLVASNSATGSGGQNQLLQTNSTLVLVGHYIARGYSQAGGSTQVGKVGASSKSGTTMGAGGLNYPNGPDNALHISNIEISEGGSIRGAIPGLWYPLHDRPLGHLDTFDGAVGELAGKTFMALNIFSSGQILAEISDTW